MNISDNAAALAFAIAGASAGSWAALLTWQVRTLGQSVKRIEVTLLTLTGNVAPTTPSFTRGNGAAHRDPRRILGHHKPGI